MSLPIVSILMLDPVILPSSRKVVDRFVFLLLDVSPHHVHPNAGLRHSPSSRKVVDRFIFMPLDGSPIVSILMLDPVILPPAGRL
jgi:hypothetical protein